MTSGPNLFVIGAMKSGTSSLDAYLGSHPQVFMAPSKEPTHFVDERELKKVSRATWNLRYWESRERYLEQFAAAGDALVRGESSTNYSKLPRITGVARRIADYNADARIVYLMRDPIERTFSHYWHNAKYHQERRDILKAVQGESHYREVSHYAMQIAPYLDVFGPRQVRAMTTESIREDPVGSLRELFAWLGVDPDHVPPDLSRRNVTGREVVSAHRFAILRRVRLWRNWDRIRPLIPAPIRAVGRRLAERKRDTSSVDSRRAAEYLRRIQQEETRELEVLLGRSFPEWTTLYSGRPQSASAESAQPA